MQPAQARANSRRRHSGTVKAGTPPTVIPAQAGTHSAIDVPIDDAAIFCLIQAKTISNIGGMGPGLRRDDGDGMG